jgi:hypothetical protein
VATSPLPMSGQLVLNLPTGSLSFGFTPEAARNLQITLDELLQKLNAKPPAGSKPVPQKATEYQYTGDVFFEIFCNPNIWPTPFAAKVLITLRDDRMRISAETELTRVIEDLSQYLDQHG